MADIPIALFRAYVAEILKRPEFPDAASITRKMRKPNTTISRPMRENYRGNSVRAETVRAIRDATGVPFPPQIASLLGEDEEPKEATALQLGMMLLERLTPRFADQSPQAKAAILRDILDTVEEVAKK